MRIALLDIFLFGSGAEKNAGQGNTAVTINVQTATSQKKKKPRTTEKVAGEEVLGQFITDRC